MEARFDRGQKRSMDSLEPFHCELLQDFVGSEKTDVVDELAAPDSFSESCDGSSSSDSDSEEVATSSICCAGPSTSQGHSCRPNGCNHGCNLEAPLTSMGAQGGMLSEQPGSPDEKDWADVGLEGIQSERWNTIEEPDIISPSPPFTPQKEPGPSFSFPPSQEFTPLDVFQLFFTTELLAGICKRMDSFLEAQRARKQVGEDYKLPQNFGPVTLCHFIGLLLYMGICRLPTMRAYFTKHPRFVNPFVQSVPLSGKGFEHVLGCLHFSTKEEDEELKVKRKSKEPYDKLTEVKWLLDYISGKCKELLRPQQNLSIDERMVTCESRFSHCNQYLTAKPTKWGFKLWLLACSRTGYTHNFNAYAGKTEEINKGQNGLACSVVQNLLEGYNKCGHVIYMNSYHTSQGLFVDLLKQGTYCVGTVRSNQIGCLSDRPNSLTARAPRGEIRWLRNEEVVYCQWKDTKVVTMASTCHSGSATCFTTRRIRDVQTGEILRKQIPQPQMVSDYTKNMRGVDFSDQLIKYYETDRKTKTWYRKFLFYCIDIAATNSYILYNLLQKQNGGKTLDQLCFRMVLLQELCDLHSVVSPVAQPALEPSLADHKVVVRKVRGLCQLCSRRSKPVRTRYWCSICKVALCGERRNCSEIFHKNAGLC